MALGISISSTGLDALAVRMRRAATTARPELVRAMHRSVIRTEADLKRNGMTGKKGRHPFWGVTGAAGNTLGARTGHTRRTVTARVFTAGPIVLGAVGVPGKAFAFHEQGGTITGRPWLRTPTALMQTGSGADRLAGRSARTLEGARVIPGRGGRLWIVRGSGASMERLYMLVRSRTYRGRHVLRETYKRVRAAVAGEFHSAAGNLVATVTRG